MHTILYLYHTFRNSSNSWMNRLKSWVPAPWKLVYLLQDLSTPGISRLNLRRVNLYHYFLNQFLCASCVAPPIIPSITARNSRRWMSQPGSSISPNILLHELSGCWTFIEAVPQQEILSRLWPASSLHTSCRGYSTSTSTNRYCSCIFYWNPTIYGCYPSLPRQSTPGEDVIGMDVPGTTGKGRTQPTC